MSKIKLRVIGKHESNGRKFNNLVEIDSEDFEKEHSLAPSMENIKRMLVSRFLSEKKIVSSIVKPVEI